MPKIIDTTSPNYKAYQKIFHPNGSGAHNGAYYYSQEIAKNITPNVRTDRPWDTLGMRHLRSQDHAIVFLHHNLNHDKVYGWLDRYIDQVLVCSSPVTYEWAKSKVGDRAIYLPLSIDVDYVSQFKTEKTKDACYAGNLWGFKKPDIEKYVPDNVDFPPKNMPREELLKFIAPYKKVYAVGRTALEAKVLGAKIMVCDSRYPDTSYWEVIDNKEIAKVLQKELNRIDAK